MTEIMIPAWVDGRLTQREKLEVHQLGLRHRAISVFLMDDDRVLLQRRAHHKYHTPGLWANTCCTHPNWGEDSASCATRRLREELGIRNVSLEFRDTVEYRADVGNGLIEHEVVDIFVGDVRTDLPMDLNPEEVAETRWVCLDELATDTRKRPERYTPWLRIYLAEFGQKIFKATA